jgi:hypothetical protein
LNYTPDESYRRVGLKKELFYATAKISQKAIGISVVLVALTTTRQAVVAAKAITKENLSNEILDRIKLCQTSQQSNQK